MSPAPATRKAPADGMQWFPATRHLLRLFLEKSASFLTWTGQAQTLMGQSAGHLLRGRVNWRTVLKQATFTSWDVLPLALLLCGVTGLVIALQVAKVMAEQGAANFIGALMALAMVRELVPIMVGFAGVAMLGSAYAAELASMRSNQQLDALTVLHYSPVRVVVLPKLLAMTLSLPLVTVIAGWFGLAMGQWMSAVSADVSAVVYWQGVRSFTAVYDLGVALLKSAVFGFSVVLVACTVGFQARPSAKAIGEAATRAVVVGFLTLAIWDLILTLLFY